MKTDVDYVRRGPVIARKKRRRVHPHPGPIPRVSYRDGFLLKRKREADKIMFASHWNRRYFVIDSEAGRLGYYADRAGYTSGQFPAGSIALTSITAVRVLEGTKFQLESSERNFTLQAYTSDETLLWVNCLEGYRRKLARYVEALRLHEEEESAILELKRHKAEQDMLFEGLSTAHGLARIDTSLPSKQPEAGAPASGERVDDAIASTASATKSDETNAKAQGSVKRNQISVISSSIPSVVKPKSTGLKRGSGLKTCPRSETARATPLPTQKSVLQRGGGKQLPPPSSGTTTSKSSAMDDEGKVLKGLRTLTDADPSVDGEEDEVEKGTITRRGEEGEEEEAEITDKRDPEAPKTPKREQLQLQLKEKKALKKESPLLRNTEDSDEVEEELEGGIDEAPGSADRSPPIEQSPCQQKQERDFSGYKKGWSTPPKEEDPNTGVLAGAARLCAEEKFEEGMEGEESEEEESCDEDDFVAPPPPPPSHPPPPSPNKLNLRASVVDAREAFEALNVVKK